LSEAAANAEVSCRIPDGECVALVVLIVQLPYSSVRLLGLCPPTMATAMP